MQRRQFLAGVLGAGLLVSAPLLSAKVEFKTPSFDLTQGTRTVNWYRPATKESLHIEYMHDGIWVPGAYDEMCKLLRDVQANKAIQMDTRLIAVLDWVQQYLYNYGFYEPLHIVSGYRSPETNKKTPNAASRSQHLVGAAVDFKVPGVTSEYLGKLFRWLKVGGVGVYRGHETVHIDVGKVRSWRG